MSRKNTLLDIKNDKIINAVENSFSISDVITFLGYSKSGAMTKRIKKKINELGADCSHFTRKSLKIRNFDNVFTKDSDACQATLREWYTKLNISEYKCSVCGIEGIWNNKPLTLSLDHINGDNKDNRTENLRWVCPNCDRQLPTFGSKNKRIKE